MRPNLLKYKGSLIEFTIDQPSSIADGIVNRELWEDSFETAVEWHQASLPKNGAKTYWVRQKKTNQSFLGKDPYRLGKEGILYHMTQKQNSTALELKGQIGNNYGLKAKHRVINMI